MDFANRFEAIRETQMDIEEGADYCNGKTRFMLFRYRSRIKNEVDVPVLFIKYLVNTLW